MSELGTREGFIRDVLMELLPKPGATDSLLGALTPEERDEIDWRTKGSRDPKIVTAAYMDVHVGVNRPK